MSLLPFNKARPLSWSAIASFNYSKQQWYDTYILGNRQSSPELTFGSEVDKRLQDDLKFLPDVPRYPLMQHRMTAVVGDIPLVGIPDGICLKKHLLADYKTGKKAWDKKRADETGQLTMYLLLLYVNYKIPPEDFKCFIHWLPTQANGDFTISFTDNFKPVTIETKRTMQDILKFASSIKTIYKEMEEYVKNYPQLIHLDKKQSQYKIKKSKVEKIN